MARGSSRGVSKVKHGQTSLKDGKWSCTPTFASWRNMFVRMRPSYHAYHRYGGRGLTICKRWLLFKNFVKDMGEKPPGKTLDRINNNRGYYPSNCRWATPKQQAQNRGN